MAILDILRKSLTKTEKFREAEENMRVEQKLVERQKSSNERELEGYIEEEREKTIKRNVEEFRKHRQKEAMETTVLSGKNQFKGKGNMMTDKSEVMKNNDKLFTMKKGGGGNQMFFNK